MLVVEGFQKFAGIPFGISRIFESLMSQQICASRRKNRSTQVKEAILYHKTFSLRIGLYVTIQHPNRNKFPDRDAE